MKECCKKWTNLEHKDADIRIREGRAEEYFFTNQRFCFCPECGSPLTPDKAELPEGYYAHPMAKDFNMEKQILDIMNKIDKILEYLKQKETQ